MAVEHVVLSALLRRPHLLGRPLLLQRPLLLPLLHLCFNGTVSMVKKEDAEERTLRRKNIEKKEYGGEKTSPATPKNQQT